MAINFTNQSNLLPYLLKAIQNQQGGSNNKTQDIADAINEFTGGFQNKFNIKRAMAGDSFLNSKDEIPTSEQGGGDPYTQPEWAKHIQGVQDQFKGTTGIMNPNYMFNEEAPEKMAYSPLSPEYGKDELNIMGVPKSGIESQVWDPKTKSYEGPLDRAWKGAKGWASGLLPSGEQVGDFLTTDIGDMWDNINQSMESQAEFKGTEEEARVMKELIAQGHDPIDVLSHFKGVNPQRNETGVSLDHEYGYSLDPELEKQIALEQGSSLDPQAEAAYEKEMSTGVSDDFLELIDYGIEPDEGGFMPGELDNLSDDEIMQRMFDKDFEMGKESPMPPEPEPGFSLDPALESEDIMGGGGDPLSDLIEQSKNTLGTKELEQFKNLPMDIMTGDEKKIGEIDPSQSLEDQYDEGVGKLQDYEDFNMLDALSPENSSKPINNMLDYIHKKESGGGTASKDSLDAAFKREGAQGEYQQRPTFVKDVVERMGFNDGKPYDPNDPNMARKATEHYLKWMLKKGYSPKQAIASYNAGETGMKKGYGDKYAKGWA